MCINICTIYTIDIILQPGGGPRPHGLPGRRGRRPRNPCRRPTQQAARGCAPVTLAAQPSPRPRRRCMHVSVSPPSPPRRPGCPTSYKTRAPRPSIPKANTPPHHLIPFSASRDDSNSDPILQLQPEQGTTYLAVVVVTGL
jgi:hypothetical protein